MKSLDPIVDEVRAMREDVAKQSDHDIDKIVEAAREPQTESGHRIVTLAPRRPSTAKRAS